MIKKETIQVARNKKGEEETILAFIPLIVFFVTFLIIYFLIKIYRVKFNI